LRIFAQKNPKFGYFCKEFLSLEIKLPIESLTGGITLSKSDSGEKFFKLQIL